MSIPHLTKTRFRLSLVLAALLLPLLCTGCPNWFLSPPELTGISGNTVFPVAGSKAHFALLGENFNTDDPPPSIHVGSQAGPAVTYSPDESWIEWLFVDAVPAAPDNKAGRYPLWVGMYEKGGKDPNWLHNDDTVAITYVESKSTWQSLGPNTGSPGDRVHINGADFHPGMDYRVMFGTQQAEIAVPVNDGDPPAITKDGIFVFAPELATKATTDVKVTVYDPADSVMAFTGDSGLDTFKYLGDPSWQSLGPDRGKPGDVIHVNGSDFHPDRKYEVRFNDVAAKLDDQSATGGHYAVATTGIFVVVPESLSSWGGKATVSVWDVTGVTGGKTSSLGDKALIMVGAGGVGGGKQVAFTGAAGMDTFKYLGEPSWQSLGPGEGKPGDVIHVNGSDFHPDKKYEVRFNGVAAKLDDQSASGGRAAVFPDGIFVVVPAADATWNGKATVTVLDITDSANGKLVAFTGVADRLNIFTYQSTCTALEAQNPYPVGKGYVQSTRRADEKTPYTGSMGSLFKKVDIVNPALVNREAVAVTSALEQPYRYKSWASGMLWADNATTWYSSYGPYAGIQRQTPVYADPLIVVYSNAAGHNYYQQLPDSGTGFQDNNRSLYGVGYHLAMPAPVMESAANYNSGSGDQSYNENCLIFNGDNKAIQRGLSMMAAWRDTLVVYPSSGTLDPAAPPLYLPATAKVHRQGDFDIEFIMDGAGFNAGDRAAGVGESGQYLKLTMAQGSPFAQFTASQTPGVVMAGVFPLSPSGAHSAGLLPKVSDPPEETLPVYEMTDLEGGSGKLHYAILYQQVNWMYGGATNNEKRSFSNWVSFALVWDPETVDAFSVDTSTPKTLCHLKFKNAAGPNHFVVVGLPSQISNSNTPADAYDAKLAENWAKQLVPYAFNFYVDTDIDYEVGGTGPNDVTITYAPSLLNIGPALNALDTVFLLQPHQYTTRFADGRGGLSPLVENPDFLTATGDAWTDPRYNKYWISRGKLEALAGDSFSLNYVYPGVLPFLPMFDADAARTGLQPQTRDTDFNLRDMSSAMIAMEHYLSEASGKNSPATTSMDSAVPQDTYNVAKSFIRTAKMLHMLLPMVGDPAPPSEPYHVGSPGGGLPEYTPAAALKLFTKNLAKAFAYYFDEVPTCVPGNTASYYYSYYDDVVHHLMLYPASGAPAVWPTNLVHHTSKGALDDLTIPLLWDGYGTVTMLNDHHYTYGYHILAAALLAMALQHPDMPADVKNDEMLKDWWLPGNWGAVVDQIIMDIAYHEDVTSWYTAPDMTFPKLEYMDEWSGMAWADGFIQNVHYGHNANSPWESLQAWTGMILWGEITGRQDLRDLGIYLYTLGLYSIEAYTWNTTQTFVPEALESDYGRDDTFLFRADMDMAAHHTGALPYWELQNSAGQRMWDRQMSDGDPARGTMRITFVFQSGLRADNTYNQTPLGQQYTSTYPHAPWALGMVRSRDYMKLWAEAIQFQNGQSFFESLYSTNTNLLYAALGLNQVTWWKQGHVDSPLPYKPGLSGFTYPESAFRFMDVLDASPYDAYWKLCAWTHYAGKPVWQEWEAGLESPKDKVNLYVSADQTIAEPLLYYWTYDTYGLPEMTLWAQRADGSPHPLAIAFRKPDAAYTFIAYNAGAEEVTVQFQTPDGTNIGEPSPPIAPYTMTVWPSGT